MTMISLVIATKDRPDFLTRLLRYYADVGFKGRIMVGDSSSPSFLEQIRPVVEELQGKIDIDFREYPDLSHVSCMKSLVDRVSTKYMAALSDDDFIIPRGMERCIEFLEGHPDYIAAHGLAALFSLKAGGAYGEFNAVSPFGHRSVEDESGAGRLLDFLGNYSITLFSVRRVEACRDMYGAALEIADRSFGGELLPHCLSAIYGKNKMLNCFYMVRQAHDRRYCLPDAYDWVTNQDWLPSYQAFQGCLTNELALRDSIDADQASNVVKQAFWSYLCSSLNKKAKTRQLASGSRPVSGTKNAVRRVPILLRAWHQGRSFFPGQQNQMSLPALVRPLSRYHADFMPIHRAVTGS